MNVYLDRALDDLKLINQACIKATPVYEHYLHGRFSLWSCIQAYLLPLLVKRDATSSPVLGHARQDNSLKLWLIKFFILTESVLALLWYLVRRPRVLVYSPDIVIGLRRCDTRIGQVYDFLGKKDIVYGEIIHAPLSRSILSNFLKRRRLVIYLEVFNIFFSLAHLFGHRPTFKMVEPDNIIFSAEKPRDNLAQLISDLSRHIPRLEFGIKILSRAMRSIGASKLIMIDDSRHWGTLMIAAHDAKVQTIAVQHGRFSEYLPGYRNITLPPEQCPVPDQYIVWNEFWRSRLIELSETFKKYSKHLIVGGRPHESKGPPFKFGRINDGITTILIPFEPHTPFASIHAYVKKILELPLVEIVYKIRPDIPLERQILTIPPDFKRDRKFKVMKQLNDMADKIDIVAGTYSTFLYEMTETGMPVIVLSAPETQAYDLVRAGFAKILSDARDAQRVINTVLRRNPIEVQRQAEQLVVNVSMQDTLGNIFGNKRPVF